MRKAKTPKEKAKPLSSKKEITKRRYRQPTIKHFQTLEDIIKKSGYSKEVLRIRALEFLRLETLKRAYPEITKKLLDQALVNPHQSPIIKQLLHVRNGGHLSLIDMNTSEKSTEVLPFLPPSLRRQFGVKVLKPGEIDPNPRRALCLSIDPNLADKVISAHVLGHVREWQRTQGRKRTRGAGRPIPLSRLWEALRGYDAWKRGKPQKAIGYDAQTFSSPATFSNIEDRGELLIRLAKRMIQTSKAQSSVWMETFL